jgi:hypothetical protein
MSTALSWLVNNTAGNFIVDTLFSVPGFIAYIRLHRKIDRNHQQAMQGKDVN